MSSKQGVCSSQARLSQLDLVYHALGYEHPALDGMHSPKCTRALCLLLHPGPCVRVAAHMSQAGIFLGCSLAFWRLPPSVAASFETLQEDCLSFAQPVAPARAVSASLGPEQTVPAAFSVPRYHAVPMLGHGTVFDWVVFESVCSMH